MTPEYLSEKVRGYLAYYARTLSIDNLTILVDRLKKLDEANVSQVRANSVTCKDNWNRGIEPEIWQLAFQAWELERRKNARICIYCEVKLIPTPYNKRTGLAGECLECSTSCNDCSDKKLYSYITRKGYDNE